MRARPYSQTNDVVIEVRTARSLHTGGSRQVEFRISWRCRFLCGISSISTVPHAPETPRDGRTYGRSTCSRTVWQMAHSTDRTALLSDSARHAAQDGTRHGSRHERLSCLERYLCNLQSHHHLRATPRLRHDRACFNAIRSHLDCDLALPPTMSASPCRSPRRRRASAGVAYLVDREPARWPPCPQR